MAHWLFKSEPDVFSWDDLVKRGAKGEPWTGIRNHTAKLNMMKMKKGDLAFFYHSNEGKEVVGTVEIVREHYPDPTDESGKFVCVDIAAKKPLKKPVTLVAVKAETKLADMELLRLSRLSVQAVTPQQWQIVCKMGGI